VLLWLAAADVLGRHHTAGTREFAESPAVHRVVLHGEGVCVVVSLLSGLGLGMWVCPTSDCAVAIVT
jgi:hypothetical protein